MSLPFLTLPDPKTTSEGVLDPLWLSIIADQLADEILPGLRARMVRPRFLTAMAVSAAVYEGLEERLASDGVTPPSIVFEWLLVMGFAGAAERADVRHTPGIAKARTARDEKVAMCARAYLRIPSVFGFHGVYKPLARHLGIVDDDLRLAENGHELLNVWEREQKLAGFIARGKDAESGRGLRDKLNRTLERALKEGAIDRSSAWQGWSFFGDHLLPSQIGRGEAKFIRKLLQDARGGSRGEVFRLVDNLRDSDAEEVRLVKDGLRPHASEELAVRFAAIEAYEAFCERLESAFDWLRYLSARAGARALGPTEWSRQKEVRTIASGLPKALEAASRALDSSTPKVQTDFLALSEAFDSVNKAEALFEAVLHRHADVQKAKQPDGKREWFEHGVDGSVFVRVPYRVSKAPEPPVKWGRPIGSRRLSSFVTISAEAHEQA